MRDEYEDQDEQDGKFLKGVLKVFTPAHPVPGACDGSDEVVYWGS